MEPNTLYNEIIACCTSVESERAQNGNILIEAILVFDKEFGGFKGHFPDQPVLPAIIQMAAVRYLAESVLKTRLVAVEYKNTKFKGIIEPEDRVRFQLDLTQEASMIQGAYRLMKDGETAVTVGDCVFRVDIEGVIDGV